MNATFKKMAGAMLSAALLLTGCTVNGGYYEEKYDNPLADTDVGGYNVLTLLETKMSVSSSMRRRVRSWNWSIRRANCI